LSWLDFRGTFWSDGKVAADDHVTSLTAVGENAQNGAPIFSTTNWSVVLEAQGGSPAAQQALEMLCRTYWRPIYTFIKREGTGPDEAEDLTQEFFAMLLERRNFDAVRKEKGRLRSYLLTSVKHFLVSQHRRAVTVKRGKGQQPIPLGDGKARQRTTTNPAGRADCNQARRDGTSKSS
jgi:RNA polymerase sigma-70 factor (ECF subfamily)